jgi:ATP-dependent helicase/DNAse subunit B
LLAGLPQHSAALFAQPAALHAAFAGFAHHQLVLATEPQHLPLPQLASTSGPGSLLAAQSACPFQAFAKHRLYATELEAFRYGLPAAAVGEMLHRILQEFWLAVHDSSALTSHADTVQIRLHTAITNALNTLARKYPYTVTSRFEQLEHQRLLDLLTRWLDLERLRRPFTVTMTERQMQWSWQTLQLNVRLDRVDHTANGAIVIDYKSGKVASTDGLATRPEQPQLLLYQQALQQETPVAGLLYAKLGVEKLDYAGITAADEGYDKLVHTADNPTTPDWPALQQHWRQVLESLAQEYLDGLVVVAPQSQRSCRYCHLPALCRISELRKQQQAGS